MHPPRDRSMEVATGVLPRLLPKLGDLLISEYNLQKGVKGEIMFLKAELECMKVPLEKISGTPANQVDDLDKIWARDVRELSYDIEDSIDTFMVRAKGVEREEQNGFKKFIDRSLVLLTRANIRRKIATDIREIKIRIEEVSKRHDRYKIYNDVAKPITVDPRLFSQYNTELVGIDDARDEIIKILMEGNQVSGQQHKIVSLVGLGGLGKTTLANVVYEKLRRQFDCSALVSVGQVPDRDKLFKDLLYQLAKQNSASVNDLELRELLQNKRYFIVLDDLWDISAWNMISNALPDNNCGYKIITTTRISSVAEQVGIVYKMKPLSLHHSRILLYSRIFGTEDDRVKCPNEELVEVSNKILKKCAGVPLAIITIASLLASKGTDKIEWYEVYNSIVSGLESSQNVNSMRSILSLSYYSMTPHLRTCLLYLSMFPEDFEIGKDRLIWMWIAEGIIHCENQSKSLFELGESYFNELVNSSMIQVYESYFGMTIHCRVHDMVLDLLRSLSREENFVTISYGTDDASPSTMVRRLSLQNGKVDHATTWASSRSMQHVRSIVVFPSAVNLTPSLGRFKVLRVLDLEDCVLSQDDSLKHIGKLFHLRYLGLRGTRIAQLPEEIGTLQFLQTLDVAAGTGSSNLPPTILRLRHLMCLRMEWCKVPNGIGNLTSLEELSFVWITDDSTNILEELGNLTELRVLIIVSFTRWTDCLGISLMDCLRKLKKLQTLRIKGVHGECNLDAWVAPRHLHILEIRHCCQFSTLPPWMNCSLRDLSVLSIAMRVLPQEDFEILGTLPALRYLQLEVGHATLGILQRSLVPPDSFPCLVRCELWGFGEPVAFCQGAMPMLVNLRMEFYVLHVLVMKEEIARRFPGFDLGLGNLSSLQAVTIDLRCDGASMEEVTEGEDYLDNFLSYVSEVHPNNPSFKIDTDTD